MSDNEQVEALVVEDGDPEAIFRELGEKEQSAAEPEEKPEDQGQVEAAALEGQAATDTPAEDTETPSASKSPDDLWKDAAPELREAYQAAQARAEKAENVAKVHSGRLTQVYRERDALQAKITEATKAPPQIGGESDEDYRKRMTEEFPDFAPLFDRLDGAKAEIDALKTAQTSQASAQTEGALQEQLSILEQAHPTYRDDVKAPGFVEWALRQPDYTQTAIRANAKEIVDGASAAHILTRYKAETADPEKKELERKRADQMEASRATTTSRPSTTATGADDPEGIWKELAAKERRAAGNRR